MDGLFFLLSIAGVALVMRWMVNNDQVAPDQPTTGLFAMAEQPGRRRHPPKAVTGSRSRHSGPRVKT